MRTERGNSTKRQAPIDSGVQSEEALNLIRVLSPGLQTSTGYILSKEPQAADVAVDLLFSKVVVRLLPQLQQHLDTLKGQDFGPEGNSELARNLNRILRRLGCCINCPKCGESATAIRYLNMGRGGSRLWRFEHTPSRRHGGTRAIPTLEVRIKPKRPTSRKSV